MFAATTSCMITGLWSLERGPALSMGYVLFLIHFFTHKLHVIQGFESRLKHLACRFRSSLLDHPTFYMHVMISSMILGVILI